jgi:hypothetical protein
LEEDKIQIHSLFAHKHNEKRETMPIPIISHKEWTDYRNLLIERSEYKVSAQSYIQIEGEEIDIEIKDVERAIMSLRNDKVHGPESIYAKVLKNEIEKLYRMLSNIINI